MKRYTEIIHTEKRTETIEIDLPIYSENHVGDFRTIIYYRRINEDLSFDEVRVEDTEKGLSYAVMSGGRYKFDGSEPDYHLGKGCYESSEANYDGALNAALQHIKSAIRRRVK